MSGNHFEPPQKTKWRDVASWPFFMGALGIVGFVLSLFADLGSVSPLPRWTLTIIISLAAIFAMAKATRQIAHPIAFRYERYDDLFDALIDANKHVQEMELALFQVLPRDQTASIPIVASSFRDGLCLLSLGHPAPSELPVGLSLTIAHPHDTYIYGSALYFGQCDRNGHPMVQFIGDGLLKSKIKTASDQGESYVPAAVVLIPHNMLVSR